MTDTIIKGSGNSRTLRTVPNALTLYPDWPAAVQAMVEGTFPVDIGNLTPAGVDVLGTALNKANLLADDTAAMFGLGTEATVNDALGKSLHIETGTFVANPYVSTTLTARDKIIFAVIYVVRYDNAGWGLAFHTPFGSIGGSRERSTESVGVGNTPLDGKTISVSYSFQMNGKYVFITQRE